MNITIHRCLKKPGLIIRAKTYFLELNEKGLYVIALGNATQMPVARGVIEQAAANAAVKYFDNRYEKQIAANEQRIRNGELDRLATERHSHFLRREDVQLFKAVQWNDGSVRIRIKGGKLKITLFAPGEYLDKIREMEESIGKRG
jgi:hypothetical protein